MSLPRLALPLLAAFLGAFLATLWLVGSLYRGRRVERVRDEGWREPYDPEYEVTGV